MSLPAECAQSRSFLNAAHAPVKQPDAVSRAEDARTPQALEFINDCALLDAAHMRGVRGF